MVVLLDGRPQDVDLWSELGLRLTEAAGMELGPAPTGALGIAAQRLATAQTAVASGWVTSSAAVRPPAPAGSAVHGLSPSPGELADGRVADAEQIAYGALREAEMLGRHRAERRAPVGVFPVTQSDERDVSEHGGRIGIRERGTTHGGGWHGARRRRR